jgi:Calcineurin-like phosphoesterase
MNDYSIVQWDLDGSMRDFAKNIYTLVNQPYRMACMLGDILCDRGKDGFQILQLIDALKKRGKNIEVLIGNHDAVAFYTLIWIQAHTFHSGIHDSKRLSKKSGMFNPNTSKKTQHQFAWLNEFKIFLPENGEIWPVELISRMKWDERWRDILRYLTEMKIGTMQNNTVLFHTPPSKIILDDLQKRIWTIDNKTFPTQLARAIEQVNRELQAAIKTYLSNPSVHNQERDKIATILHIYCHTLNSCNQEDLHGTNTAKYAL